MSTHVYNVHTHTSIVFLLLIMNYLNEWYISLINLNTTW